MDPYTVTGKYFLSAIYVAIDFVMAWALAWLVRRRLPVLAVLAHKHARLGSNLLGCGLLLTAAIGTLSWPLHAVRDQEVFFWLSLAGSFLLIYAYALCWFE